VSFGDLARRDPDALAARLEAEVRTALGSEVWVAIRTADRVDRSAGPEAASRRRAALGREDDESRIGRAALAAALRAAGRDPEASPPWPCRFASLSHSRGVAVAVVLDAAAPGRAGLGVDLELDRVLRPGLAAVFCDARELAWLDAGPADLRDAETLRLWTAKEALYKADAAQGDAIVAEYRVAVPALDRGGRGAATTRLCALRLPGAALSVALEEEPHVAAPR
jgi:4'-phosphopantetheinyl transferase EntD